MPDPTIHWLPLAHHHRAHRSRCVTLPLGSARLALCARCLGLYPTMAITLALQAALGLGSAPSLDWWLVLGATAPGLLDWGSGLLEPASGTNRRRIISGILLGVALGRSVWLYLRDPHQEVFWVQVFLVISVGLAVLLVKRVRPDGGI